MLGLLSGVWGKVAIVAGAAIAVLAILAGAKRAGRTEAMEEVKDETNKSIQRQRKAAASAPADKSSVIDSMRDGSF